MQKLKKALKKLGVFGQKSAVSPSSAKAGRPPAAQAAKKAPAAKKKTQAVAAPKKAAKKPIVAGAKKAAAPAKKPLAKAKAAAPAAKQDLKKKPLAPVKAAAPVKPPPAPKTAAVKKAVEPAPVKPTALKAAPQPAKKAAPSPEVVAAAEKKAKGKKDRADADAADAAQTAAANVEEEVILTDADGRRYCRVKDCDQAAAVGGGYCRFHYLLFWKNIQNRKKILSEGKLERYVEELTARYPDKYLELLRKDLRSEKDFTAAIQELEIDESAVDNEMEDEAQNYLDEVRGMSSESQPEREEDF